MAEENQDNTMEDILSSIKNILEEDEAKNSPEAPRPEADVVDDLLNSSTEIDDVLELSPDMRIEPSPDAPVIPTAVENEVSVDISLPEFNEEETAALTIGIEDETSDSVFDGMDLATPVSPEIQIPVAEEMPVIEQTTAEIPVVTEYNPEPSVEDLPAADEKQFEPDISFEEIIEQDEPVVIDTPITEPDDIELVKTFEEVIEEPHIETPVMVEPEILPEAVVEPIAEEPTVQTVEAVAEPTVVEEIAAPAIEVVAEPTVVEEIAEPAVAQEVISPVVEEVIEPVDVQPEKADAVDVSAGIISNFAKMFAKEEPAAQAQPTEEPAVEIVAAGNTGKTLEEFVLEAVTKVIGKEISRQWNDGAEFKALAEAEINRQTREWLNDNLPTLVEKVVKQEIERVIAKVGS